MADHKAIGVDIGGTHITAARVDLQKGVLMPDTLRREHVNAKGDKAEIIRSWAQGIERAAEGSTREELRIGVAMPGPFDYAKGVSGMQNQEKYDALYSLNVKQLLADELQIQPAHIQFMNDAACFLQGEAFGGAAKGAERAIGLTLGTGLGSAFYSDGLADDAALWCSPFKAGIAEDYVSSRWFTKRYRTLTGNDVSNVKSLVDLLPSEPLVQIIFDEFGQNLGKFLVQHIRDERPQAVVIGGNIAQALELFMPALQQQLASQAIHVPIKKAELGEEAALIGAASLWK